MKWPLLLLLPAAGLMVYSWFHRQIDVPADQPCTVQYGRFVRGLTLGGFVGCSLLAPLAMLTAEPVVSWFLLCCALLFALAAPAALLSCVCYGEGGLTIRTCFGVTHELRWEDMISLPTHVNDNSGYLILRTKDKRYFLNPNMIGCDEFVDFVRTIKRNTSS